MRLVLAALLAVLAFPVYGQQISPMTGTTASPPTGTTPTTPRRPHHRRQSMQQRFDAANATHDGKLTLEQAKTGKIGRIVKNFDTIDTGKKGYVTMDDIHAFNRAQRAAKKPAAQ